MKKLFRRLWTYVWKFFLAFFIISILSVVVYRFVPVPFTPLMLIRVGEQIAGGKDIKLKKDWKSISVISPDLPLAVVSSEDQLFLEHFGFDVKAIEKAIKFNKKKKGKKVKGASTISQQTAKNVFLWQGRTWIRKGLEVYFTALIELLWSKQRIMEVYLNVIEMGDGIYGAEAAAHNYFNKDASKLSKAECAAIAAVLPNPIKWNAGKPTPYIEKRKAWILKQMNNLGGELEFEEELESK